MGDGLGAQAGVIRVGMDSLDDGFPFEQARFHFRYTEGNGIKQLQAVQSGSALGHLSYGQNSFSFLSWFSRSKIAIRHSWRMGAP